MIEKGKLGRFYLFSAFSNNIKKVKWKALDHNIINSLQATTNLTFNIVTFASRYC